MSWFKKLLGALAGPGTPPKDAGGNAFWVYVKCNACQECVRTRVNLEHDLSADYDGAGDAPTGYICAKELVGRNCFLRIKVTLYFDGRRRLTEQQVEGGSVITKAEFDAAQPPASASSGG